MTVASLLALIAGCTQSTETPDTIDTELLLSNPMTHFPAYLFVPVFNAYVGDGAACAAVPSIGGTWTASQTFAKTRAFCTYVWSGSGVADADLLRDALVARGVLETDVLRDYTCVEGTCARPISKQASGAGGSGGSACYKCVHAALEGSMLNVALPPELVTPGPSKIQIVVGETLLIVDQPGNAAAFTIYLTDRSYSGRTEAFTPGVSGLIDRAHPSGDATH